MSTLELGAAAEAADLVQVATEVADYGAARGWDSVVVMKVNLMLEELIVNVREHGGRAGRRFDARVSCGGGRVRVNFSDTGAPFDPLVEAPLPDVTLPVAARRPGGLGVHLVRTFADELRYARRGDRNVLELVLCL